MRILYLVPELQHPTMRGALRHYHLLRHVADRHAVTTLALAKHSVTTEALDEATARLKQLRLFPIREEWGTTRAESAIGRVARKVRRRFAMARAMKQMRAAFRSLAERDRFDLVLFHGKEIFPVIAGFRGLPIVADCCDATSLRMRGALRYASPVQVPWRLLRYVRVARFERQLVKQTRHLAFISRRDRDAVLPPDRPAAIIPNGIDHGYWTRKRPASDAPVIVFTGLMDYPPNLDAARFLVDQVFPRVRRTIPDAEVWIVGRDPAPELVDRGRSVRGVTVTGFVDDMRPYLERATVFVAPLRFASGLQNKLLEALAMEVPVVTTGVSAAGIEVTGDNVPVRVADGADALADATVQLLMRPDEARARAREGRSYVERHFDWDRSGQLLEALCRDALREAAHTDEAPPQGAGRSSAAGDLRGRIASDAGVRV